MAATGMQLTLLSWSLFFEEDMATLIQIFSVK